MISPDYVQMMADYNRWQNSSVYAAASTLDQSALTAERGAFFGSIEKTLNHLLWGDQLWMSRFADTPEPDAGIVIGDSVAQYPVFADLRTERQRFDEVILKWSKEVDATWLEGTMTYFSGAMNTDITKPTALLVTHMFNHQTHHRGQVHAMLTAAGAKPGDTDLPLQHL